MMPLFFSTCLSQPCFKFEFGFALCNLTLVSVKNLIMKLLKIYEFLSQFIYFLSQSNVHKVVPNSYEEKEKTKFKILHGWMHIPKNRDDLRLVNLRKYYQEFNLTLKWKQILIILKQNNWKNGVFWVVTPCGSCENRSFGGTWRLLHQSDKNRWTRNNTSCEEIPWYFFAAYVGC
jgi:hypothetical protein